jgi:diadenosine tetraphosphate (Ap4A) HIT family hydrolase
VYIHGQTGGRAWFLLVKERHVESQELLDAAELAGCLKVTAQTVRTWARQGRIPEIRITSKVKRFDFTEVVEALKSQRTKGPGQ